MTSVNWNTLYKWLFFFFINQLKLIVRMIHILFIKLVFFSSLFNRSIIHIKINWFYKIVCIPFLKRPLTIEYVKYKKTFFFFLFWLKMLYRINENCVLFLVLREVIFCLNRENNQFGRFFGSDKRVRWSQCYLWSTLW